MEAAYGSKRESKRRWSETGFYRLAQIAYQAAGIPSIFVGTQSRPALPTVPYCIDLRQKLDIPQLATLLRQAHGFIGNDSGPLHLANLVKTPSIGIYLSTSPQMYGPIFPKYNTPILQPQTVEDVIPALTQLLSQPCLV